MLGFYHPDGDFTDLLLMLPQDNWVLAQAQAALGMGLRQSNGKPIYGYPIFAKEFT